MNGAGSYSPYCPCGMEGCSDRYQSTPATTTTLMLSEALADAWDEGFASGALGHDDTSDNPYRGDR